MGGYDETYRRWQRDPDAFWLGLASAVEWEREPEAALDASGAPLYRWFPDGRLNMCFNLLDRHVRDGRGEQAALIYDSPVTGHVRTYTYRELLDETARVAGAFARLGVGRGDRVVVYMPMVPEALMAMMACARLGAIHSVVFGGFAANELASRIEDCGPKLIVAASCGIEPSRVVEYGPLLNRALEIVGGDHPRCVILQRPQAEAALVEGRDVSWEQAVDGAEPAGCVTVQATDPLYVLYTSGTTGVPKGIVRDTGGYAVALQWSMGAIYGADPGDIVLGGLRHRLGRRPLVHRLRAASAGLHDRPLRGQAGRHTRCRRVLARVRGARGGCVVHRADGDQGDQAR